MQIEILFSSHCSVGTLRVDVERSIRVIKICRDKRDDDVCVFERDRSGLKLGHILKLKCGSFSKAEISKSTLKQTVDS
jgi:hypothetical protein